MLAVAQPLFVTNANAKRSIVELKPPTFRAVADATNAANSGPVAGLALTGLSSRWGCARGTTITLLVPQDATSNVKEDATMHRPITWRTLNRHLTADALIRKTTLHCNLRRSLSPTQGRPLPKNAHTCDMYRPEYTRMG